VLLAGDIGGTNARLMLVTPTGRTVRKEEFASRKYPSLDAVVREFLQTFSPVPKLTGAAFGVAGPVVNGRVVATNLPWVVDARLLARKLGIKNVTIHNDLVALSLGAMRVTARKLHTLTDNGVPKKRGANIAVIAAGTGLGEAVLVWDGEKYLPTATEGGHSDFAPRDDDEVELLQFLRGRYQRVSWERVLSGNGLGALYDFFCQGKGITESVENTEFIAAAGDRNAAISTLGLENRSEAAARALQLFATLYGSEAGNLALKTLALGGVYVCGGIAAHMLPVLDSGVFRKAFRDKGRLTAVLDKIPVAVVLDSDVGLAGAASSALEGAAKKGVKRPKARAKR
jgi:glucokinase